MGDIKLIVFAKHLKGLSISAMVEEVRASGVDGLDLTIRNGYAVNPENMSTALPELIRALKDAGFCLPMCSSETTLTDSASPAAETLVATLAANDVCLLKMGYFLFDGTRQDYWKDVEKARRAMEGWAKLSEKHGVTICYHTHSGLFLGSTAGALHHLIQGFSPEHIGAYLDAGHLSAAGEEFPMACGIVGKQLKIVSVKDIAKVWRTFEGRRCVRHIETPLDEAWLDLPGVFAHLVRIGYTGPVSLHVEYPGTQQEIIESARRDGHTVHAALRAAQGR